MLSQFVLPVLFPVYGFTGYDSRKIANIVIKKPLPEDKKRNTLPRELTRVRTSALTNGKKYGSVIDVLRIVYGQDFGAILKEYVESHLDELHRNGIMRDSMYVRFGGIGRTYIETNYYQPKEDFLLDVVVDCLLEGEHYPQCESFYIRYKMNFCAMNPRCFLWKIGLYRSDEDDALRDTKQMKADGNLLPRITAAKFDEIAEYLLNSYNPEALSTAGPVDVYKIAKGLDLMVNELQMQDANILGQMHFWPGQVEHTDKRGCTAITKANPMDIFINTLSCKSSVAKRSSLAHEIGHLFCSRKFELLQIMAGNKHGAVVNKRKKQLEQNSIPRELEAQPAKFSGHLLLPRRTALPFVEEEIGKLGGHASPRQMEAIVRKVMDTFQVSRQMATLRLKDFGYDIAKGVNRYVDGHYVPAYGTSNGEWKNGIDYIIEHKAVFELYCDDAAFRRVIDTGRFVFVENHLCLADRRYIRTGAGRKLETPRVWLTDYARNHIDECCLAFRERGVNLHRYYDGILNREICKRVVDYRYDPMRSREENIQIMDEFARINDELPSGFGKTIKYHMSRVGVSVGDLAEAMELDSKMVQYFRKELEPVIGILPPKKEDASKNKNHLTKRSVVTMALLMHLMPDWSDHLLHQAHYILDKTDREEKVWWCTLKTSYMCAIEEINATFRDLGITALTSKFPEDDAA